MAKSTTKKKKKAPKKMHVEHNKKEFLAKECIMSMSAIHTRILKDGTAIIRISDCHGSIKLWNDLNIQKEGSVMTEKLDTLINHLCGFRREIELRTNSLL